MTDGQEIGEILSNGTFTGCFAALVNKEVDIGFNMRLYRLSQFERRLEATYINGRDDICLLVPRYGASTNFANIFRPFQKFVWLAICLAVPCYTLAYYFLRPPDQQKKHSFFYYYVQFFSYTIQQQMVLVSKLNHRRFLIAIWITYAMFISSMYQSKLSGTLIIPKDRQSIDTFDQLAKSDLQILTFERYARQMIEVFYDPKYGGAYEPLVERLINVSIGKFSRKITDFNRSMAFTNKFHINMHLQFKHKLHGEVFYHRMKQCPVPYIGVYGLKYGTPYKARINFILRQAQESGLMQKWESSHKVHKHPAHSQLRGGRSRTVSFNLSHLQSAFYVYSFGCFGACCLFIGELLWSQWRSRQSTKSKFF